MICPRCNETQLIVVENDNPRVLDFVCPRCKHYESNSEAFKSNPHIFNDLGRGIIKRLKSDLMICGLASHEAEGWLANEPEFVDTKRIATPLDTKQQRRVTLLQVLSSLRLFAVAIFIVKNRLLHHAPFETC